MAGEFGGGGGSVVLSGAKDLAAAGAHKLFNTHLWEDSEAFDGDDVGYERWHYVSARKHEDDQQLQAAGERAEQFGELRARLGVQPYERIVEDEHSGHRQERAGQLELPKLPAGKRDDETVQQFVQAEHRVQTVAEGGALRPETGACRFIKETAGPRLRGLERPLQQSVRRGCLVVDVLPVPAFLEIIVAVSPVVGVPEGNIFDVLGHQPERGGREVELQCSPLHGQDAPESLYQPRLARSVVPDHCNLLSVVDRQAQRPGHPDCGIAGLSVGYLYYPLSFHIVNISTSPDFLLPCLQKNLAGKGRLVIFVSRYEIRV